MEAQLDSVSMSPSLAPSGRPAALLVSYFERLQMQLLHMHGHLCGNRRVRGMQ